MCVFVHLHKQGHNKLDPRAPKCAFLGYSIDKRLYMCYHRPSRMMFITMDVVFHKDRMYISPESEYQEELHREI